MGSGSSLGVRDYPSNPTSAVHILPGPQPLLVLRAHHGWVGLREPSHTQARRGTGVTRVAPQRR